MKPAQDAFTELLELVKLEQLEVNLFRGESRDIGTSRVFGGQVLAQAVLAASETVDERLIHSLHAYFLRAGDDQSPIVYNVDRSRDGRSFTARRVVAIQHGRPIFTLSASFQLQQDGLEHQTPIPEVPPPESIDVRDEIPSEDLERAPQKLRRWFSRFGPFEFRVVVDQNPFDPQPMPPVKQLWFRLRGHVGDGQVIQRALLAYASDFHLVGTATLPHGISFMKNHLAMASLDHAMWFHRDVNLDEWLLYTCDSPNASGGRGLARGMIHDQDGRLVASTAQEGMIRVKKD
ncbi:MAG: acyl-CoA thioesterase II [Xanthomonadales bacterium]|nr:acyl-CoA thioesterase II [Gammaproteobacteria bacterium]NNE05512.1 acyl-CoA thioesterase II [Xanthomonadales bacterium]NNL94145.1 acyl-CoA thioesterase II [Xanthomonadales bacterium]